MKQTIPIVVLVWAALFTVVGTHAACDSVARRLRRARHRYLTRKHGTMLQRTRAGEAR